MLFFIHVYLTFACREKIEYIKKHRNMNKYIQSSCLVAEKVSYFLPVLVVSACDSVKARNLNVNFQGRTTLFTDG